ncbi:MAG: hypothetical protein IKL49_08710 [Lachnospiraceae bacterium]|nr:hypothetical protein [Lachnospiraceae bacterium]
MEAAGEYPAEINMGLTEILLIVLGVLAFVGSFVIPESLTKDKAKEMEIPEEKIKELVEQEVKQAAFQIEEKTDETISAAAEKTERYMERLSNEKIMAIQEYSDTVLSQINKNHEEAVFLYDMLNNKHIQVKNTAAEINTKVQDVKADIDQTIQEQMLELPQENNVENIDVGNVEVNFDKTVKKDIKAEDVKEEKTKRVATKRKAPVKKTIAKKKSNSEKTPEIEIQFEPDSDIGSNKSKILKLHEEGKSNMAIAKSLGLGIGEVKLIIDLFESGE